jgi:hypothetical protein
VIAAIIMMFMLTIETNEQPRELITILSFFFFDK